MDFCSFIHEDSTNLSLDSVVRTQFVSDFVEKTQPNIGSYFNNRTRVAFLNFTPVQRKTVAHGENFENEISRISATFFES